MIGGSAAFSFLAELVWKREFRSRPTKNGFANFTPRRFCRYFTDDDSRLIVCRVSKRNVQIAVCFNLHSDNAASKSEPLVFDSGAL